MISPLAYVDPKAEIGNPVNAPLLPLSITSCAFFASASAYS